MHEVTIEHIAYSAVHVCHYPTMTMMTELRFRLVTVSLHTRNGSNTMVYLTMLISTTGSSTS